MLALLLLVFRILADYHDMALPLDDLALLANRLNAGSYFHDFLLSVNPVIRGFFFLHAVCLSKLASALAAPGDPSSI